jgi:hypothetical protein
MVVKTFRGLLVHDGQDRIRLRTIQGKVGYRITKFELQLMEPGSGNQESTIKIYKSQQSTVARTINFTDSDLLAAGYITTSATGYQASTIVVFDSEIFNQDIYITHSESVSGSSCNYYMELEVIPLDEAGAEYTTLKDMRST